MSEIDGHTFVFVPNEDWTVTTVFELETDGHARERFAVPGILNNWVKLR